MALPAGVPVQCPCSSGRRYDDCCGPLHRGERQADTAVELMRSRYAAYAVGATDYVYRTWHPRTRPAEVRPDPGLSWTGLSVVATDGGSTRDDRGAVEFVVSYRSPQGTGRLHEVSAFERRANRWFYVDGVVS